MTVTYTYKVANARLCGFTRLLCYWKGSIYKIMYKEMLIYLGCYGLLSAVYRFGLRIDQRSIFEKVVLYCQEFTNLIPLSFVLGFYVALVVGRWWNQYMSIPWPDRVMTNVAALLHGSDERSRMMRRTIVRYINLTSILLFRAVSVPVAKRFPTMEHIVDTGMMTEEELKIFDEIQTVHSKYWVPMQWATNLASQARQEGRIKDDMHLKTIVDEINAFRGCCGMIYSFDWISIPLVYTQTTTLAVYTYFLASVIGSQYLDPSKGYKGHEVDLYVPVFNVLQFFFYMGWIKVAEQLINPFGEDDDDFETNYVIDRNIQVAFLCVDEMYMTYPDLQRDAFWDDIEAAIPYTKSTVSRQRETYLGSTANLHFGGHDTQFISSMDAIPELRTQDNISLAIPIPSLRPGSPKKSSSWLASKLTENSKMSPYLTPRDEKTVWDDRSELGVSVPNSYRESCLQHQETPRGSMSTSVITPNGYINYLANDSVHVSVGTSADHSTRPVGVETGKELRHDQDVKRVVVNCDKKRNFVWEVDRVSEESLAQEAKPCTAEDEKKVTFNLQADKKDFQLSSQSLAPSEQSETCNFHIELNSDGEEVYLPVVDQTNGTVSSLTPLL